jgi:nitrite reductase/ring-hydroxylating ferredoxin subunit
MSWTSVLAVDALPTGEKQVVKAGGRSVLLVNHQGNIYAVDNLCPHLKLPMNKAKISGDCTLTCPWHRSKFDMKTGAVEEWTPWPPVVGQVLGAISSEKPLPVFPTKIEGGQIWVDAV